MSNVILSAIVILILVSCNAKHTETTTAKAVVKDSVYTKNAAIKSPVNKPTCENCPAKKSPPVWYIWDSKRFFW